MECNLHKPVTERVDNCKKELGARFHSILIPLWRNCTAKQPIEEDFRNLCKASLERKLDFIQY